MQLALTPTGGTTVNLVGNTKPGINLATGGAKKLLPVIVWDEEYADSIDTEGALRVRSRPTNPVGTATVIIEGTDAATLATQKTAWGQCLENSRKYGATLVHTPDSGPVVTFDVISAFVTEVDLDEIDLRAFKQRCTFQLTYLPFGRLAPVVVL
jgi:hypothetical protein